MAVTTEYSTQYNQAVVATDPTPNDASDWGAPTRRYYYNFTQGAAAGDANSLQVLVKLPGRRTRIYGAESWVAHSAFGAGRTLDVGYQAYTKGDGTAGSAVVDAFVNGLDVSGAGASAMTTGTGLDAADTVELDIGKDGLIIEAKVLGNTIPAAATLIGYFTVQQVT